LNERGLRCIYGCACGGRAVMGLSPAQAQALLRPAEECRRSAGRPRRGLSATRCCHGVERASCRMCGGGRLCVHLEQRKFCVQCGGTRVCEHKRNRVICVECGGNRVCRTCRVRVVLKRDTDCTVCRGAREWAVWMGDRLSSIYSTGGVVARGTDAGGGAAGAGGGVADDGACGGHHGR
jgi:hypothetical protein